MKTKVLSEQSKLFLEELEGQSFIIEEGALKGCKVYHQSVRGWLEESLEEIELETAKTIANAARKAGLVPEDLAEYKDWEKSLAKHTEDTLKERVEEVLKDLPSEKLIEELVDRGYSKIELVKQKI